MQSIGVGDGVRIVLRTGLFDHQLEKENDESDTTPTGGGGDAI